MEPKDLALVVMKNVREYIQPTIDALCKRMDDGLLSLNAKVDKRLAEIEERGICYRGVWQAADDYKRGDLTTFDGGMWHANCATRERPGNGKDWTLAVRKGADAK